MLQRRLIFFTLDTTRSQNAQEKISFFLNRNRIDQSTKNKTATQMRKRKKPSDKKDVHEDVQRDEDDDEVSERVGEKKKKSALDGWLQNIMNKSNGSDKKTKTEKKKPQQREEPKKISKVESKKNVGRMIQKKTMNRNTDKKSDDGRRKKTEAIKTKKKAGRAAKQVTQSTKEKKKETIYVRKNTEQKEAGKVSIASSSVPLAPTISERDNRLVLLYSRALRRNVKLMRKFTGGQIMMIRSANAQFPCLLTEDEEQKFAVTQTKITSSSFDTPKYLSGDISKHLLITTTTPSPIKCTFHKIIQFSVRVYATRDVCMNASCRLEPNEKIGELCFLVRNVIDVHKSDTFFPSAGQWVWESEHKHVTLHHLKREANEIQIVAVGKQSGHLIHLHYPGYDNVLHCKTSLLVLSQERFSYVKDAIFSAFDECDTQTHVKEVISCILLFLNIDCIQDPNALVKYTF